MQRYIFVDLDDTLFQTHRKCPANANNLAKRAISDNPELISYATEKQQWLWQWLAADFKVIPVTGRDASAFARVELPFTEEIVLNHGAVILNPHRQLDQAWMSSMHNQLPHYIQILHDLWQEIIYFCQHHPGFKTQLIADFDCTWYGVIKHQSRTEASLLPLLQQIIQPHPAITSANLYWHLNGNNLAVLPKIINKESAVAHLLQRYRENGEILCLGAGDSHSDAPFLALCDYALIPQNTQLSRQLLA